MPTGDPYCPTHGLKRCKCNCEQMIYKPPYKVRVLLAEISDADLENVWWKAMRRDELNTVYCDPEALRRDLGKLLHE